jgi:Na+-transporting methylmalonyl-CoA/oxaloacetate decarboxylase gamma subunit
MAAPPRTKTRASWRPEVPPPPVAGAPVGKKVVVVGTGDGLTVVVAGVGVVVCVLGCVVLVEALAGALEVAVPDDDDDPDEGPDGEKIDGTLDDGAPVQAETVAATRTIKAAQLRTASRGLLAGLAEVMRILMEPP